MIAVCSKLSRHVQMKVAERGLNNLDEVVTVRRLNRYEVTEIRRLSGIENFVSSNQIISNHYLL